MGVVLHQFSLYELFVTINCLHDDDDDNIQRKQQVAQAQAKIKTGFGRSGAKKKEVVKKSHVEHHERAAEKIDGFGDKNHCGAQSSIEAHITYLYICRRSKEKTNTIKMDGWKKEEKKGEICTKATKL